MHSTAARGKQVVGGGAAALAAGYRPRRVGSLRIRLRTANNKATPITSGLVSASARVMDPDRSGRGACAAVPAAHKRLQLRALAADAASELHVFGHDRDAFGVDGAQIAVFEQPDEVCFSDLLPRPGPRAAQAVSPNDVDTEQASERASERASKRVPVWPALHRAKSAGRS